MLSAIATFLLGVTIGAAAMVPFTGQKIEKLMLEKTRLLQDVEEYKSRLEKLETARQQPRDRLVEKINLQLLWADEATRLDLVEKLNPITGELIGREVESIDPYLLFAIFDERIIDLNPRQYRLSVRSVLIAEETTIILTVREVTARPAGLATTIPGSTGAGGIE